MRPLSEDILEFVHERFSEEDVPEVLDLLQDHVLSTPRVQRSVLFLSGGSLSMLRHYVSSAALDVREILVRAEYVLDVSSTPMAVRNMAQPFGTSQSTAAAAQPQRRPAQRADRGAQRPNRRQEPQRHRHLADQSFVLGSVEYTVTSEQPNDNSVRCLRRSGNVVSIVHLPLVFVIEQLSEHIELQG